MRNKIAYLLACIDHFTKYAWTIPIKKGSITVRNTIDQVFMQGYPELIQSDNENRIH